jgi:hypothetical protein
MDNQYYDYFPSAIFVERKSAKTVLKHPRKVGQLATANGARKEEVTKGSPACAYRWFLKRHYGSMG